LQPEVSRIVERLQRRLVSVLLANCVDNEAPAAFEVLEGLNNRPPGRRGVNDGVQFLRRPIRRVAGPAGAQRPSKRSLSLAARKHENAGVWESVSRQLQDEVRRGAKARQPEALAILQAGQSQ